MNNATGRCLCGAVSFTADDVETDYHSCHCGMCRRWSGGPAFAARVGSVRFDGEQNICRFQSSAWAERGFCGQCGTNLFYFLKPANQTMLWIGTFDDQSSFRLTGEIFVDDKPDGYAFAGDHQRLTGAQVIAAFESAGD